MWTSDIVGRVECICICIYVCVFESEMVVAKREVKWSEKKRLGDILYIHSKSIYLVSTMSPTLFCLLRVQH